MAVRDLTARNAIEGRLWVRIYISIFIIVFSIEFFGGSVGVVRIGGPWTGPYRWSVDPVR